MLPESVDKITPSLLTDWLIGSGVLGVGEKITAFATEQIGQGKGFLSDVFRLRLSGDGPETLIVKLQTTTPMRDSAQQAGVYDREVVFYRDIADRCPMNTPKTYFVESDNEGGSILLLEDLGHLYAPDHLVGLDIDRAEIVMAALAEQHAWSASVLPELDDAVFQPLIETYDRDGRLKTTVTEGWRIYQANQRRGHNTDIDNFVEAMPVLIERLMPAMVEPRCLVHGDLRVDNLFFDGDQLVVVDHQFGLLASGLNDVAYLISQGMERDVRLGHEQRLVELYRDRLAEAGQFMSQEKAWDNFCAYTAYLAVFPFGAIRGWELYEARARDLMLTLVERWIDIVEDLKLYERYCQ